MAEESRSTHKLYEKDKIGEVQIADEVVAIIAGLAATEVEGVDSRKYHQRTGWKAWHEEFKQGCKSGCDRRTRICGSVFKHPLWL